MAGVACSTVAWDCSRSCNSLMPSMDTLRGTTTTVAPTVNGSQHSRAWMSNDSVVRASSTSVSVRPGCLAMEQRKLLRAAVHDLHALGLAGRAGGVDDVGQVFGRGAGRRVVGAVLGDGGPVAIEADDAGLRRGRLGRAGAAGSAARAGRVLDVEGQAVGGEVGVERHVGGAGLEDAQQAHQHVQRTLDAQADQHVRSHAQGLQMLGELVGAGVQLAVGEPAALEDHGDARRASRPACSSKS